MEEPWKFEIKVKEKTRIFNFPLLRKKQRGKNVIYMEKSWKFETRVK